jgi:hypothetical protein
LLAVLLFVLLLIMGKVNTSAPDPRPAAPPETGSDPLLKIDPVSAPDSLSGDTAGNPAAESVDSARAPTAAKTAAQAAAEDPVESHETRVRVLGLSDSVWLRVLPAGDREVSVFLRRNRPQDFQHEDAITFITRQGGAVRVFLGDTSVVPDKRRFKIDGAEISY